MTGDLTILDKLAAIIANSDASDENKYAAIQVVMLTRRPPSSMLTLSAYDQELAKSAGNPLPVDALALVFGDGRACVCVRIYGSSAWREIMSAPGTTEDGLACGVSLRSPDAFACAPFAIAGGPDDLHVPLAVAP
jgi:hypothetical protein